MKSLIIELLDNKYLIRYKVLKSVVSRKHTTKEGKVVNRLEVHPNSVVVYLYQILHVHYDIFWNTEPNIKGINKSIYQGYLKNLGKGLSKCSDKDRFNKNIGIICAVNNIENLNDQLKHNINYFHMLNLLFETKTKG